MILAVPMVLSLASCGAPAEDTTTVTTEATTALEISDLSYSKCGTIEDFQITGTIHSSSALERIEMNGQMVSQEMEISISMDDTEPFYFEDGVTSADLSVVKDYLVDQMSVLYAFSGVAVVDIDGAMTVQLNCICYDAAGDSVNFMVKYDIIAKQ